LAYWHLMCKLNCFTVLSFLISCGDLVPWFGQLMYACVSHIVLQDRSAVLVCDLAIMSPVCCCSFSMQLACSCCSCLCNLFLLRIRLKLFGEKKKKDINVCVRALPPPVSCCFFLPFPPFSPKRKKKNTCAKLLICQLSMQHQRYIIVPYPV
jgi:hypothetical protein